ncbi:TPA: transposase [Legionella pneumophila]|nr:transposase [Legionella pneumophila]HDV5713825.1 transposase [Legionella pneumophila]HDV5807073.1 transposase [Legionella pneumophila]HEO1456249.1 transposase [Legionella pneumophila]HEO1459401.1 transposase [Legionella pneumophila]
MPRTHGYSLKGTRCYGLRGWGERGRINAIGALRDNQLLTVSLFEGTINTTTFNSWVEHDLLPKLPKKVWLSWIMLLVIRIKRCKNN